MDAATNSPTPNPVPNSAAGDLVAAAKRGDLDAVRALLDAGADINQVSGRRGSRGTALTWAARRNRPAVVRELLACGADASPRDDAGRTALMWAAEVCPARTVAELVARCAQLAGGDGANLIDAVDAAGESALQIAASAGRADVVMALLTAGANIANGRGRSALARLAGSTKRSATQLAALRALLAAGADVNAADPYGYTALILLCVASNHSTRGPYADGTAVTCLLLDMGADVNTRCGGGYTALMWAARAGATAQIRLLLERGANPNLAAPRPNGTTALLESAHSWCGTEPMRLLLEAGADVNAQENLGRTALMFAASSADAAQVRLLLSFGANPTLQNTWGRTARECLLAEAAARTGAASAKAMKVEEVEELLREAEDCWTSAGSL